MVPPALSETDVRKVSRMGEVQVEALRGVEVSLGAGEVVVLPGPSGTDKSTLLNSLGRLDVPTTGPVVWADGRIVSARRNVEPAAPEELQW